MKYMLLIYGDQNLEAQATQAERDAVLQEYFAFAAELRKRGISLGGDELGPSWTATTLRMRGGNLHVTDGPFAETKEQLGGYFLLQCASLDEAIDVAKLCPAIKTGSVELRPIVEND
jgi:hypothetical protein